MAIKISETKERWCCEPQDLMILEPLKALRAPVHEVERLDRFCKYCGTIFEYHGFTDAAGSMDWDYRPKVQQASTGAKKAP